MEQLNQKHNLNKVVTFKVTLLVNATNFKKQAIYLLQHLLISVNCSLFILKLTLRLINAVEPCCKVLVYSKNSVDQGLFANISVW